MTSAEIDARGLGDEEFEQFRRLIRAETGIALGPQKRHLLRARLDRRLRALGLTSYRAYREYLEAPGHAAEMTSFVNAITTNKTDFFREPHHFDHLRDSWAPARRAAAARGEGRRIRVWSAACSTGEEPYTIAIALSEAGLVPPAFDTRILASDIDTEVLAHADAGVYAMERVSPVPPDLLRRHFLRRRGEATHVRVRPELRALVTFRRINFNDAEWPVRTRFDVIFCRNALIYFDRDGQRAILERLIAFLEPGGLLILGHSESLFGLADGMVQVGNTIYARQASRPAGGSA